MAKKKKTRKHKKHKNPQIKYAYSSYGDSGKSRWKCIGCGKRIRQKKLGRPRIFCKTCRNAHKYNK